MGAKTYVPARGKRKHSSIPVNLKFGQDWSASWSQAILAYDNRNAGEEKIRKMWTSFPNQTSSQNLLPWHSLPLRMKFSLFSFDWLSIHWFHNKSFSPEFLVICFFDFPLGEIDEELRWSDDYVTQLLNGHPSRHVCDSIENDSTQQRHICQDGMRYAIKLRRLRVHSKLKDPKPNGRFHVGARFKKVGNWARRKFNLFTGLEILIGGIWTYYVGNSRENIKISGSAFERNKIS